MGRIDRGPPYSDLPYTKRGPDYLDDLPYAKRGPNYFDDLPYAKRGGPYYDDLPSDRGEYRPVTLVARTLKPNKSPRK